MSSDPLLPDLSDVPADEPATPEHQPDESDEERGSTDSETGSDVEHPTGEKQAQENRDREPPA